LRFPEFEDEWENIALNELGDFKGGGTPSSTNLSFWNGSIPWISSSDLDENSINNLRVSRFITQEAIDNSATKFCDAPVILIVSRVGVGKVVYSNKSICTSQDFLNITNIRCNGLFLAHLLSVLMKKEASNVQGTSIKGISSNEIKSKKIFIPKDIEQQRIASFLSLLDERIQTQIKIIKELKVLKNLLRNQLYERISNEENEILCIKEILEYEQPTKYLVTNTDYSSDNLLVPVLTANKAFILGYTDENFGVYEKGDCIIFDDFTMDLKYVDFSFKVKSSAIKILKPRPNYNLKFIFEYLHFLDLQSTEHKRHYISEIEPMEIAMPNIGVRNDIAKVLSTIDKKIVLEIKTYELLSKQKQYLLQNLFI